MPCVDALADNLGVLGGLLVQEFPERGDVEADEATATLPDNAVLEETAFVLTCIVAATPIRLAISETLLEPESGSIANKNSMSLSESSR